MAEAAYQLLGRRCVRYSVARTKCMKSTPFPVQQPRSLHVQAPQRAADKSYQFVVCGGGPGGLAVASSLGRRFGEGRLAVIEPANVRRDMNQLIAYQICLNLFRQWCTFLKGSTAF